MKVSERYAYPNYPKEPRDLKLELDGSKLEGLNWLAKEFGISVTNLRKMKLDVDS